MKQKTAFIAVAAAYKIIPTLGGRQERLVSDIQKVAACAILHANTDGDNNADIGIRFVGALKKDVKRVSDYLVHHGNFAYVDSVKQSGPIMFARKDNVVSDPEMLAAILESTPWNKFSKAQDEDALYEAGKALKSIIKRIEALTLKGRGDQIVFGSDNATAAKIGMLLKEVLDGAEVDVKVAE